MRGCLSRRGLVGWLVMVGVLVGAAGAQAHVLGRVERAGAPRLHAPVAVTAWPVGRRGFAASAAEVRAASLRTRGARRATAPVRAGAELPWLRRARSDTFMTGSGRLLTKIYPFAVNYRTRTGLFAPISSALVASGSGYAQRANDLGVVLPASASAPARVSSSGGALAFGLVGASGPGTVTGTVERFPGALAGVDLAYGSENTGIAWQTTASAAVARQGLTWLVRLTSGLTAKRIVGGVAFVNAHGKMVWVFVAPAARRAGSGQPVPTTVTLSATAAGTEIHVQPKVPGVASAQAAGGRSFAAYDPSGVSGSGVPVGLGSGSVTINGEVVAGNAVVLGSTQQTGDCYIDSTSPDTSFCGSATNFVGPQDSTLVNFDIADNLPAHVQILKSYLAMQISSQTSSSPEAIGVWQAAQPWTNLATWNTYDGWDAWNTPGGDTTGVMEDQQTLGASGATGSYGYWDINQSMQGWVDGSPPQQDGLILKPVDPTAAANTIGFATETSTNDAPYIGVTYEPRMGDYPGSKYDSHTLTDRSRLGVNVATGNLWVSNTDARLAGINGLDLTIGRYYNNLSSDETSFGVGWSMGAGADTYLEVESDYNNVIDYFDGTGNAQMFYTDQSGNWVAPPGEDATLRYVNNDSQITLFFRHSGITETFDVPAGAKPVLARLASVTDRNANTITYSYNASGQLTAIVDSYGNAAGGSPAAHTTTLQYSSAGYVSQITDPTGRTYKYVQNASGQLTQYTDPAGNPTDYTYDAYGNLTQITTPQGNITNIGYDAGNTNRVTSLTRLVHPTDTTGPTTSYQFATASGTCPANDGWTQGTVSDPDQHVTTYCSDDLGRIRSVIDANGHTRSTAYTADGFISSLSTPLGVPTTFAYSTDGNDNVTQIQQGAGGGPQLTRTYAYTDATNPYQATSATDPQNHAFGFTYNTTGNLTKAQAQTSGDPTNGDSVQITHNADGTVATSTDADANQTTYHYTGGNLTEIVPPSGSGLNSIAMTYDSADRVIEISTINATTGHEVEYSYDNLDHVTQAIYKDAAGSTVQTITYVYDKDGHLTSQTDSAGTTSYTYDGLGRLTAESYPNAVGSTMTYDPAGNLTGLDDGGGTVSYAYDKANQVTSVTDPGASKPFVTFAYNNDGQLLRTIYASGASQINTYNPIDQLASVTDNYKTASGTIAHLSNTVTYTTAANHPGSLIQSITDQANATTTYTYDALNRLTDAKTATSSGTTTADYAYTLDPAGNITQLTTSGSAIPNTTTSYAYNPANQTCWAYTGASTAGCAAPPAGAHAYTYDPNGNQTSNGNGLTATYNALDQTTSATTNGTTTNYSYLGQGQDQLIADGTTSLQNDPLGVAAQTTNGTTTYYEHAINGTPIEERTPTATYNYLYDATGNVIALTDSTGHLANHYTYTPYGTQTTTTSTVANPFGFQAGYTTTSGLIHYGARYLNPTDARWTQPDPLNNIGSLTQADRYSYAGDNPIDWADSAGLGSCSLFNELQSDFACRTRPIISAGRFFYDAAGAALGCYAGARTLGKYGEVIEPGLGGVVAGIAGCAIGASGTDALRGVP